MKRIQNRHEVGYNMYPKDTKPEEVDKRIKEQMWRQITEHLMNEDYVRPKINKKDNYPLEDTFIYHIDFLALSMTEFKKIMEVLKGIYNSTANHVVKSGIEELKRIFEKGVADNYESIHYLNEMSMMINATRHHGLVFLPPIKEEGKEEEKQFQSFLDTEVIQKHIHEAQIQKLKSEHKQEMTQFKSIAYSDENMRVKELREMSIKLARAEGELEYLKRIQVEEKKPPVSKIRKYPDDYTDDEFVKPNN